jgi:hypothetical protein
MIIMRKRMALLAAGAAIVAATAGWAAAADHLVSADDVQAQLAGAAAQRRQDVASIEDTLESPLARDAAASMGVDLGRLRAAVPALSDADLRDLAARAAALQSDPVAGLDADIKQLLTIFLIVAIVILVLQAVD